MSKYLKLFETHSEYETYIGGQNAVLPNVSYCEDNNEVYYNPIETRLVTVYNISDTSEPTSILWNASGFTEIEIDGVKQPSVVTSYQFSTTGEHIVKYTLAGHTIGEQAFAGRIALVNVIIPNSVTSIDFQAFVNTSLTSVTIPDSVTSIGNSVFGNCPNLTSITIGNGVTSIGQAFQGCSNLSTITSHITNAPSVNGGTFWNVKSGGTLYVPIGSSGYETWMNDQGNLGQYGWTKVEQ